MYTNKIVVLNYTLLEKAQSMQLEVYLLDSWWEFAVAAVAYIYNYIFVRHLK